MSFARSSKIILLLFAASLAGFFFYFIFSGPFFLMPSDEISYYNAARSFMETGSMQSTSCIAESISIIGGYNWYGPFYHIIYGSIAKVFGFHILIFPWLHFGFTLLSVFLLYKFPISSLSKNVLAFCFLASHAVACNIFTLFPEAIHLFSGVLLSWLLIRWSMDRQNMYNLLFFLLAVGFFSLIRPTTIFWLSALIPFAMNRKDFFAFIALTGLGILAAFLYMHFFTAPAHVKSMHAIDALYGRELFSFFEQIFKTLRINVHSMLLEHDKNVMFFLLLLGITTARGIYLRDRLLLSAALSMSVLVTVLMFLYVAQSFFFLRQLNIFLPFILIANIAARPESPWKKYFLVLFVLLIPFTLSSVWKNIRARKESNQFYENHKDLFHSFSEIKNYINKPYPPVVLWNAREHAPAGRSMAFLPVSDPEGKPVLYTSNITSLKSPSNKFAVYKTLKIDYVLSKFPLDQTQNPDLKLKLLFTNNFYSFYENME